MPVRVQRKRTKGSHMPVGSVYVGRPTAWGNPIKAGERCPFCHAFVGSDGDAAMGFRRHYDEIFANHNAARMEYLRGKDLACWCPLDKSCHADVLLEMVNR